jgi:hypothetical protein
MATTFASSVDVDDAITLVLPRDATTESST